MRSTKDKTLCTTVGCNRLRSSPKAGKCSECLAEARYELHYRKHQTNGNRRNEADVVGTPALSPNEVTRCRRFGCDWTGIRRDLWKHIKDEHS